MIGQPCDSSVTPKSRHSVGDYAKDGGLGVVCPSCSFYHDPLQYKLFYLVRYTTHIHRLASGSFPERVQVISKLYDLK